MRLDLQEVILALPNAVGLIGIDFVRQNKRLAYMVWARTRGSDVTQRKWHHFTPRSSTRLRYVGNKGV